MDEREIKILIATRGEDLASALNKLDDTEIALVLGNLSDGRLARVLGNLSDGRLALVLGNLSDGGLALVLGNLSDGGLARVLGNLSDGRLALVLGSDIALKDRWGKMMADVPFVENLYTNILVPIEAQKCALDQANWECGTTRCVAGHTVYAAGKKGLKLRDKYDWSIAALLIHRKSRPNAPAPSHAGHIPNDCMLEFIRARAEEEAKSEVVEEAK